MRAIITVRQPKSRGGPSRPPAHVAHYARGCKPATPEKARSQRRTAAMTMGIKWPGPLPSKRDPRAVRAPGSKNRPSKGAITD
jgi:hypothetical protein